jgi:hypothetical protein
MLARLSRCVHELTRSLSRFTRPEYDRTTLIIRSVYSQKANHAMLIAPIVNHTPFINNAG